VALRSKAWVCSRSPVGIAGSNSAGAWMFACCECCVCLSGRGLCDGLITRPEESYRLCCVIVCDLETSRMRRLKPARVVNASRGRRLMSSGTCECMCFMVTMVSRCSVTKTTTNTAIFNPFNQSEQDKQCTYNVTMRRVHETIVVVEKR
jgi:hypothetical protein